MEVTGIEPVSSARFFSSLLAEYPFYENGIESLGD